MQAVVTHPDPRRLDERDLDRLADSFMACEEIATVRVEAAGSPTVYRADVRALSPGDAEALAEQPARAVCESLGLRLVRLTLLDVRSRRAPCPDSGCDVDRAHP